MAKALKSDLDKPEVKEEKSGKPKVKTVYTHNKKFVIPIDKPLDEFLKEKFPSEYKD